mmetsp:Transcript_118743/g.378690  ORF Transcript_118743/g.378690 Transcript_118743/m.378690 type:complete len:350 (-) Transcript_118743:144-1193(-)
MMSRRGVLLRSFKLLTVVVLGGRIQQDMPEANLAVQLPHPAHRRACERAVDWAVGRVRAAGHALGDAAGPRERIQLSLRTSRAAGTQHNFSELNTVGEQLPDGKRPTGVVEAMRRLLGQLQGHVEEQPDLSQERRDVFAGGHSLVAPPRLRLGAWARVEEVGAVTHNSLLGRLQLILGAGAAVLEVAAVLAVRDGAATAVPLAEGHAIRERDPAHVVGYAAAFVLYNSFVPMPRSLSLGPHHSRLRAHRGHGRETGRTLGALHADVPRLGVRRREAEDRRISRSAHGVNPRARKCRVRLQVRPQLHLEDVPESVQRLSAGAGLRRLAGLQLRVLGKDAAEVPWVGVCVA